MPIPLEKSPFFSKYWSQKPFRKSELKKRAFKLKSKPFQYTETQSILTYPTVDEDEFYKLLSKRKEAVVNFSKGSGFKATLFHIYLKVLSSEHREALFAHIDTEKCVELKKKLGLHSNPTLVVMIEGEIRDIVSGFKDFKSKIVMDLASLKARLASSGVIEHGGIIPEKPNDIDQAYIGKVTKDKLLKVQKRVKEES